MILISKGIATWNNKFLGWRPSLLAARTLRYSDALDLQLIQISYEEGLTNINTYHLWTNSQVIATVRV